MNNFVQNTLSFTTQADADDVFSIPLDLDNGPMTLVSAMVRLDAVAGSPTAVTLDVDITDGSTTQAAISGQSIGTAAGQVKLTPTQAAIEAGTHIAAQDTGDDWRADVDFNFTGGSSPTVSGEMVLRWAV